MARYHNTQVNGMNYEQYAYDYIVTQGNTDIEDITDEMCYQFEMREGQAKSLAQAIIWNTNGFADKIAQRVAQVQRVARLAQTPWQEHPATSKQIQYLIDLGVRLENGMTKARASALIDAAKNSETGSIGGFYRDGSN